MEQAPIVAIEEAIYNLHGCAGSFRESTWVEDTFEGDPVWADEVHLFDLEGHPTASLCYGWAYPCQIQPSLYVSSMPSLLETKKHGQGLRSKNCFSRWIWIYPK